METLAANFRKQIRRESLHGRTFVVAPITLIVPGVLNGSQGALFYSAAEIAKSADAWNGMPITLQHPRDSSGKAVSGRTPSINERQGIGTVYNSHIENGKLIGEAWFDLEATRDLAPSIAESLERNEPIELSTGLFTDNVKAPKDSEFGGVPYSFITRNYRPDHLAILPDQVGACSLEDGCGVLNIDRNKLVSKETLSELVNSIQKESDGTFTFSIPKADSNDNLSKTLEVTQAMKDSTKDYMRGYTEDGKLIRLLSKDNPFSSEKKGGEMPLTEEQKTKLVTELVANCEYCDESDALLLNKLSDEKLLARKVDMKKRILQDSIVEAVQNYAGENVEPEKLAEFVVNAAKAKNQEDDEEDDEEEEILRRKKLALLKKSKMKKNQGEDKTVKTTNVSEPKTEEEWFKDAPLSVQNTHRYAKNIEEREKMRLVSQITANVEDEKQRVIVVNRLKDKNLDELVDLAILSPLKQEESMPISFMGAQGAVIENRDEFDPNDILETPTINWSEDN